jgi:polyphosphate glucokinase
LKKMPPGCRAGDNANAFLGGFRLWEHSSHGEASTAPTTRRGNQKATKG